jgi:peptidoglycan/LPS O-acetylase OafA/YrhL
MYVQPLVDFYSPLTRFWELMSGSILAWIMQYKNISLNYPFKEIDRYLAIIIYRERRENNGHTLANCISLFGFLCLMYGFLRIDKNSYFPGTWALIPVLSTMLIIYAGPNAWINKNVLSNKVAVFFGLISYPLYLWHWPLLSFSRIIEGGELSAKISLITICVAITFLDYI